MESQNNFSPNKYKNLFLSLFVFFFIIIILIFNRNNFQSTLQLRNFGNLTMDPEIAFTNGKPTYLEFYAQWCEICKKMAPEVTELKKEFDNEINFVFLNVDNPNSVKFIKQFRVNGIPQINIIDSNLNLQATFTGLQEEITLRESINHLIDLG
tara:strand:+ start:31 stop:489 length:459 start_codon:yes stop_codon:yes gene_type:complete